MDILIKLICFNFLLEEIPMAMFFKRFKIFQKVAIGIFLFFMGLMCLVFIVAMQRTSGSTGLDMSKVQQMRSKAFHRADRSTLEK